MGQAAVSALLSAALLQWPSAATTPSSSSSSSQPLWHLPDVLTGGADLGRQTQAWRCVKDEPLTLRFAASLAEFGPKRQLLEEWSNASKAANFTSRTWPLASTMDWTGPRKVCEVKQLSGFAKSVLKSELFPFTVETIHRVVLDHLERVFDLGLVYHDFYAGTLREHGGPLDQRGTLVKRLAEFAFGNEGDPEGYAYPQLADQSTTPRPGQLKPATALELAGQFFYHAHSKEQCRRSPCDSLGPSTVSLLHLRRVAPLHMRKAFSNFYHYTTVALARLVALLPRLRADPSIVVVIPHPNKKGQSISFIRESVRLLGIEESRIMEFPPCRLLFVEELLLAGAGPRAAFGKGSDGRDRAVMSDIADTLPSWAVRRVVLRALAPSRSPVPGKWLLIDRTERRRIRNLPEVMPIFSRLQEEPGLPAGGQVPVFCENLTFASQVEMFAAARLVVAVHGACLVNSLYMPPGSAVVDLVPMRNFMGAGLVMPLECGVTWFWTLAQNANLLYRPLLLEEGDFDADSVQLPTAQLEQWLKRVVAEIPDLVVSQNALPEGDVPESQELRQEETRQATPRFTCPDQLPLSEEATDLMCAAVAAGGDLKKRPYRAEAAEKAWEMAVAAGCTAALASKKGLKEGMRCLQETFQKRRSAEAVLRNSGGDFFTTLRKLRHDAEMMIHLQKQNLLGASAAGAGDLFKGIYKSARAGREDTPDKPFQISLPVKDPQRGQWAKLHNTLVHVPGKAISTSVLRKNAKVVWEKAEEELQGHGIAVVERVLSKKGIAAMRSLLQESTVYYYPKNAGHFLALLEDGLACPLLASLVEELQAALPKSLGEAAFCNARAWKADNSPLGPPSGERASLDFPAGGAKFLALLWVVPKDALETEESSVLTFRNASGRAMKAEYEANRLVIWRDDCVSTAPELHQGLVWKTGFLTRGIHFVMRFTARRR